LDDLLAKRVGFGRLFGTFGGRNKEWPMRILAEVISQNPKTAWGVAEAAGRLFGGQVINEVGAERLILALGGIGGLKEELGEVSYLFVFIFKHTATMSSCSR
jgi:hypothetical protein